MQKRIIDGYIRKIESSVKSEIFYDFEFWGESDEDTSGLFCFSRISQPNHLIIVEMNTHELILPDLILCLESLKKRVISETGYNDLIYPKIKKYEKTENDVSKGFQAFLKTYKKPVPVYRSIFNNHEEATQIAKISIAEFKKYGGKLELLGDIQTQAG